MDQNGNSYDPAYFGIKQNANRTIRTSTYTAEDYQALTQVQHIFLKPDMYIGADVPNVRYDWIFDPSTNKITKSTIYIPESIERIFLEIISNAGDAVGRSKLGKVDPGKIEVMIDNEWISVKNYGNPIPIEPHSSGMLVPELIFGTLLSGSNYGKDEVRMGCGTNGLGAKLCNVFSKEFRVDVGDAIRKLRFYQVFTENMSTRTKPIVEQYNGVSYVQITYRLDFERFGYYRYPLEAYNLFYRSVLDFSLTCKVPVVCNNTEYNFSDITEYSKLYFPGANCIVHRQYPKDTKLVQTKKGMMPEDPNIYPEVEICLVDLTSNDSFTGGDNKISFINGIMTIDGGVHLDAAIKATSEILLSIISGDYKKKKDEKKAKKNGRTHKPDSKDEKKPDKNFTLSLADVKPFISLIVNCRLPDPKFKSQTKTILASPKPNVVLEDDFVKQLGSTKLLDRLFNVLEFKKFSSLKKTDGAKKRNINLGRGETDANDAGGPQSTQCTCIIVEGKSAAKFPQRAIESLQGGTDRFGIFPIRGKSLNTTNATIQEIAENEEIQDLKKFIGLREGANYLEESDYQTLRYGYIMIMADSDPDGKHIEGLVNNIFRDRFPTFVYRGCMLLHRLYAVRLTVNRQDTIFYTYAQYSKYVEQYGKAGTAKHFKGRATYTNEQIDSEFRTAPKFVYCAYDENYNYYFDIAFKSDLSDERKKLITAWKPPLDIPIEGPLPIGQFLQQELPEYWDDDLRRCIPRMTDGLKEVQGKITNTILNKWKGEDLGKMKDTKVAQLGAQTAEENEYFHGEDMVAGAIINMAFDFVGSNNLPLLQPIGQFGNRIDGGLNMASPRYLYTKPSWCLKQIFKPIDEPLLSYASGEEKDKIDPLHFLPIIPFVLINGQKGVAVGWSTSVPNYHPLGLVSWLRCRLNSQPTPSLIPWYKGFKGKIIALKKGEKLDLGQDEHSQEDLFLIARVWSIHQGLTVNDLTKEEYDRANKIGLIKNDQPVNILDPEPKEEEVDLEEDGNGLGTAMNKDIARVVSVGKIERHGDKIVITELPVGRWTQKYMEFLTNMRDDGKISGFKHYNTTTTVHIEVYGTSRMTIKGLGLVKAIPLSNMILLNTDGKPTKYNSVDEILEAFFMFRYPYYIKRREHLLNELNKKCVNLSQKAYFIQLVITRELIVEKRPIRDVEQDMEKFGIDPSILKEMKLNNLTQEKIDKLNAEIGENKREIETLTNKTPTMIWMEDLDDFERHYKKYEVLAEYRTIH